MLVLASRVILEHGRLLQVLVHQNNVGAISMVMTSVYDPIPCLTVHPRALNFRLYCHRSCRGPPRAHLRAGPRMNGTESYLVFPGKRVLLVASAIPYREIAT